MRNECDQDRTFVDGKLAMQVDSFYAKCASQHTTNDHNHMSPAVRHSQSLEKGTTRYADFRTHPVDCLLATVTAENMLLTALDTRDTGCTG